MRNPIPPYIYYIDWWLILVSRIYLVCVIWKYNKLYWDWMRYQGRFAKDRKKDFPD